MAQRLSITALHQSLAKVTTEAVLGRLRLRNPALAAFLRNRFALTYGQGGDFLSDPVIEATFGWKSAPDEQTMSYLSKQGLLSPSLVTHMDAAFAPDTEEQKMRDSAEKKHRHGYSEDINEDYTWPAHRAPYEHQLMAWKTLSAEEPRSAVITSGTGSGKTECFLVPLLNSLAKQVDKKGSTTKGVQAIMLYPLNALINSQRERLSAWMRGFEGSLRYSLYTGETPEDKSATNTARYYPSTPEFVATREDIRESPPSILVTNSTILEYMLVRPKDRSILDKSQGQLKWIVLDEAHTLVGSQAAEIAMLIRRTLLAFGVEASQVRFVATSATIGGGESQEKTDHKLQCFLAELAGVNVNQVTVISGERDVPKLREPEAELVMQEFSLSELEALSPTEAYRALCNSEDARRIRQTLVEKPQLLSSLAALYRTNLQATTQQDCQNASRFLDIATQAVPDVSGHVTPFLKLRTHLFHRAQTGLWACTNATCDVKKETPLAQGWPFGMVYLEPRQYCDCSAVVLELVHCHTCGEGALSANLHFDQNTRRIKPKLLIDQDDKFPSEDSDTNNLERHDGEGVLLYSGNLETVRRYDELGGGVEIHLQVETGEVLNESSVHTQPYMLSMSDRDTPLRCLCCNMLDSEEGTRFKTASVSNALLMANVVPELLQHAPRKNMDTLMGSRLLTFTDNRQGTARFSANLQLDAERRWARSMLYHFLLEQSEEPQTQSAQTANQPSAEQLLAQLSALGNVPAELLDSVKRGMKSSNLTGSKGMSWVDLERRLADQDVMLLLSGHLDTSRISDEDQALIRGEYSNRESSYQDTQKLARLFMLRELSRRPRYGENLESLGLVSLQYEALERVSTEALFSKVPQWQAAQLNRNDWQDFLKILLDYFVREHNATDIGFKEMQWLGGRVKSVVLVKSHEPIETDTQKKHLKHFPSAKQHAVQHRIIRLLELGLGIKANEDVALCNCIMDIAFDALIQCGILQHYQDPYQSVRSGYRLHFANSVSFKLSRQAYLCPLTHRWLDRIFAGFTPYTSSKLSRQESQVKEEMEIIPHPPKAVLNNRHQMQNWIENTPEVVALRATGGWRDKTDQTLMPAHFVRSVEHSAQQNISDLKRFEKAFKKDLINVLNCSTTMEMGVDIGSLSMVMMNNTPPSPANYLQRAGRAGRRSEAMSLAITFCRTNPLGKQIFSKPTWPFDMPIPIPKVSLESEQIVSRHINAFFLAYFFQQVASRNNLPKLKTGAFFLSEVGPALAHRFLQWCSSNPHHTDTILTAHTQHLISGTALQELDTETLLKRSHSVMSDAASHWLRRYHALVAECKNAHKSLLYRLQNQLKSMEHTSLLTCLSERGFLPSYGFPINVVELVTNNKNTSQHNRSKVPYSTRSSYPSRGLDVALSEYAPGREIVLNGAVYKSQGLQLSWKIPGSTYEITNIQKLRYVIVCQTCYHVEADLLSLPNTVSLGSQQPCVQCGSDNTQTMEYITPDGFQVDYNAPVHNDFTSFQKTRRIEPLLSLQDALWQPVISSEWGAYKVSDKGQIFYYNEGHGGGFALCWGCGRAEPIPVTNDFNGQQYNRKKPALLLSQDSHRRLSGTPLYDSDRCNLQQQPWLIKASEIDNDDIIKRKFVLGHRELTSMFELKLAIPNIEDDTDVGIENDHIGLDYAVVSYSVGVALRQALCANRGISSREIGVAIREGNQGAWLQVVLYDHAEQGAGYSSSLQYELVPMLHNALQYLEDCPNQCSHACHACIMEFDTQYNAALLDRHRAIKVLQACLASVPKSTPTIS